MSIKVMSLVWDNFPRGGSDKLAMLALADWASDDGGRIYPSIAMIGKKINLSESWARKVIHGLIDEGYLVVTDNHHGGNPGATRHYKIVLEKLTTPSADTTPVVHTTPSVEDTPSVHAHLPLAYTRVTPSVDATLTIKNHHINVKRGKPPKSTEPKTQFKPPTLEEVQAYVCEKGSSIDPDYFFEYYETSDWHTAEGKKVANWKLTLLSWENREKNKNTPDQKRKLKIV